MTRTIGHILLWIGFLAGAFVAVRSTEVEDDPWSTLSWPSYGAALFVACIGVTLLRRTQRADRSTGEEHSNDVEQMAAALDRIVKQLRHWQTDEGRLLVHEVHQQIDERLLDDLETFSELRESLIDVFDLQEYARIMTEFALAERTINRTWSASADGYIDEVDVCLKRAAAHMDSAIARLETARRKQPVTNH